MLILLPRPTITWTVGGTGVTVLTSLQYLTDGLVALPCRFTWPTGSQTTSTTMTLQASFSTATVPRGAALLCPLTGFGLPAGMKVTVDSGLGGNATTQRTQLLSDGSVGIIFAFPAGGSTITSITFTFYNDVNGSTYFTAGQVFDIGEAWISGGTDWKIVNDLADDLVDATTNRRSHNNQPQPLFRNPYDSWTFNFTPMTDKCAYDGSTVSSFKQVRYQLTTAACALILPRYYVRGTTTLDPVALHQLAVFGRPDSMQPLKGNGDQYWTASVTFSSAPP